MSGLDRSRFMLWCACLIVLALAVVAAGVGEVNLAQAIHPGGQGSVATLSGEESGYCMRCAVATLSGEESGYTEGGKVATLSGEESGYSMRYEVATLSGEESGHALSRPKS